MESSTVASAALIAALLTFVNPAWALTPEMQKAVRAATFEIVVKKTQDDTLKYEKPPPVELIPYAIRADGYWSIGTSFAVDSNTYVSAAHVLASVVNSQFGSPAVRNQEGQVHPIDRILKWSADEDYVVFSIAGSTSVNPLSTSTERKVDDTVYAVGNALGEGIVVRDGLLTSETPEQQDGRWKWLRFSAAASPGNSGGPLLDGSARAIGIVRAKSPSENLNYAVPIELVLNASPQAKFDSRYTIRLPNARATEVATLKTQFDLPLSWTEFSRKFRDTVRDATRRDIVQMMSSSSDAPFPKGKATKMLAIVYDVPLPGFVQQDNNDDWDLMAASNQQDQDLSGHGLVSTGTTLGVNVFRLRRPDAATEASLYRNPAEVMDFLLKGLKLTRPVGDQQIRVISMGQPVETSVFDDQFGRRWTTARWPLGFVDNQVIAYWLPTPEGVIGFTQSVPSAQIDAARELFKLLSDVFSANLTGTLGQWRAFLSNPDVRSPLPSHIKLDFSDAHSLRYGSQRVNLLINGDLLNLTSASELEVRMAWIMEGARLTWDVGGVFVFADRERRTFVGLERHAKPRDDTAATLLEVWKEMHERAVGFNGLAGHDDEYRRYWIHDVLSAPFADKPNVDPQATILYDVSYSTERSGLPMDLEDNERRLLQSTHVLEH